ncbi:hypothetical protein [Constantimarinum furrinae]|uniref:Plasminogen-binding protein PgbA N-terminal domain-containing protein n=1 Tax=Constantimarinum furrinae TaxID=2562285 RepID=A0A7G8PU29_9FLAO|nr:hypothetical protein [Constantimarinum furrinae]QNJ97845.1 hypothetical protein ALE3EI_1280 [Constantimarinum furrinae]
MKRSFFTRCLFIVTLAITSASAQTTISDQETETYVSDKSISTATLGKDYTGSPYANDEFQNGTVYGTNNVLATNVVLRYNVLRDEIEIKSNANASNSEARVLVKSPDIYVRILNNMYVYKTPTSNSDVSGYFLVMVEGENKSLYKKIKKKYIEGKKSINSVSSDILPMYKEIDVMYLVTETGEFEEIPNSRNKRIGLFADHKKEVKQYIKEEKLNVSKDYELVDLVKYYNTL